MKVYINTNGCAILRHETYRLSRYFELNGHKEVEIPADADIAIMTGCGVTNEEENSAIAIMEKINANLQSSSLMIVYGCLSKINRERIAKCIPRAIILGYDDVNELDTIIKARIPIADVDYNSGHKYAYSCDKDEFDNDSDFRFLQKVEQNYGSNFLVQQYRYSMQRQNLWKETDVYQVRVAYGCGGNCSYCVTKIGIGRFRSVEPERIFKQFRQGIANGFNRFVLVGDEIGFWGLDIGMDLMDLIDGIYAIDSNIQLAIRYIYPDMLVKYYERLKPYFASGFINYFTAAIQSASPRVLKMMNRNPDLSKFVECIKDIHEHDYPVLMHTHILVGFPGETTEDFLATLNCLMECNFDFFNVNKFSMRPNTAACKYLDIIVPDLIAEERLRLLQEYRILSRKANWYEGIKKAILKQ